MAQPHRPPEPDLAPGSAPSVPSDDPLFEGGPEQVLQVERRDFTDLVPTDRPRRQSLRGFDPVYTDIVDYIVRCTHRIWDERDIGLIYSHYTHNPVVTYPLHTVYDREDIVRDTIQRLVTFPERRGMATQVIWRGNDVDGFYTSHYVTGSGRHSQHGPYGPPTDRAFTTRTVADCMVLANRIYREWIVSDAMGLLRQLGLDPHPVAEARARALLDRGHVVLDGGETGRLPGQAPPPAEADISIAHTETEAAVLRDLHEIYNKRMFGRIRSMYAAHARWHGPLMKEVVGRAGVLHQALALVGTIPDCAFVAQHICSVSCEEGGEKVAVRWTLDGHHLGWALLGPPTGYRISILGITHLHIVAGEVVEDWTLYDELAMLTQIKLGELGRSNGCGRPSAV